jgi:hypothetical protein
LTIAVESVLKLAKELAEQPGIRGSIRNFVWIPRCWEYF